MIVSGSKDSTGILNFLIFYNFLNLLKQLLVKVWEVRTKKLLQDLPGHADEVFAVDWSPGKIKNQILF
jgi:WD40 repeat protein